MTSGIQLLGHFDLNMCNYCDERKKESALTTLSKFVCLCSNKNWFTLPIDLAISHTSTRAILAFLHSSVQTVLCSHARLVVTGWVENLHFERGKAEQRNVKVVVEVRKGTRTNAEGQRKVVRKEHDSAAEVCGRS